MGVSLSGILGFIVGIAKRAFNLAKSSGLSDELVQIALGWVRNTAAQNIDNPAKRELVVKLLVARGVSQAVARIAVELAYILYKKEISGKLNKE